MKTKPAFFHGLIKTAICLSTVFFIRIQVINSQSFRLYEASDLVRIFEDGYKLPVFGDTIKIFGIRGETISGQFVLYAKKTLTGVTVKISEFSNKSNGRTIKDNLTEWNFVGSVNIPKNTPNQPSDALTRSAPARFPDYLMSEKQLDVNAKSYKSVWLTICIPEDAAAGNYIGKVAVRSAKEEQSLPVSITVYPLTMPEKRHLKVIEWHTTDGFEKFHGIREEYSPEWFGMLKKYADNMVAHRQNIFQVTADHIKIMKTNAGRLEFDFTRFDQIANIFWDTKKMDMLETGFLANFGEGDWFSTKIILKDFDVIDTGTGKTIKMKGEEVVPFLLPAFETHLRQKGWLNKILFHVRDEPSVHNALAWLDLSGYIHKYAPDLIRGDAIETTFLLDDIEIAVPKLDHFATWNEAYKNWPRAGHELWFYTVGIYQGSRFPNKTIDMPLIDSRLMHWLNYRYDATGYLHWGYNQWDDDSYNKIGEHIGDGWHVYPVIDGVLNSLRWEEMRNGIQDYEYLWMLEEKIRELKDSLGSGFSWIDPKQRGKEIAGTVVPGFDLHTDDPAILYKAKMKIIKELLEFNTSPGVYVQTNPVENSVLTNHSSVEVFGWTEPGTKIIINEQEIPVNKDGLFIEQFGGEFIDPSKIHLGDRITVKAVNSLGSKVLVRNFVIR